MDLKIHDPDHVLGHKKKKRGRRDTTESNNGQNTDEDESEGDVLENSIQSLLVMKLVCRHGTSIYYLLLSVVL